MAHFIIIGAGECGARAAFGLREKRFDGRITLIGTEPHLPYERPPLSKHTLIEAHAPKLVADASAYAAADIDVMCGVTVEHIDPAAKTVLLSGGGTLHYNRLLLATGARPRPFPGTLEKAGRIRTLRSHADALAIRAVLRAGKTLSIIGGGFIGLELAATARQMGAEVVLVEGLPRILSRGVPEEIAAVVADRHRAAGVSILCGATIASLDEDADQARIQLADGRTIAADLMVVGIGALPNIGLAERAGLAIDNGIAVDAALQTSSADIWAAGDCCSFPLALYGGRRVRLEAWRNAQDQGTLAAANMLGAGEAVSVVPWFWSDQYDLTLQIAGLADGARTTVRRAVGEGAFILFHLDADGRLIAASGIGPGNAVARDIRLAEKMIAARSHPDPAALAAPTTKLKTLLAA
jgi:3-phenylpropionate/trans-cinnamate dioxygenase ferredoxin reductase subunit